MGDLNIAADKEDVHPSIPYEELYDDRELQVGKQGWAACFLCQGLLSCPYRYCALQEERVGRSSLANASHVSCLCGPSKQYHRQLCGFVT